MRKRLHTHILPLAVYTVLLVYVSINRFPEFMEPVLEFHRHVDKVIHFLSYAVLGWLVLRTVTDVVMEGKAAAPRWKMLALATVVTFAFGAFLEFVQFLSPYRTADVADAVINGAGGFAGAYLYLVVLPALCPGPKAGERGKI